MTLEILLTIIWLHFLGDFVLQTDRMAIKKSKSWAWLTLHAMTYGSLFIFLGWKYAIVNAMAHFLVDAVTSRVNAKLWANGMRHWFFVCVGFDQAVHFSFLFYFLRFRICR